MKYKKGYKYQLVTDEVFKTSLRPAEDISLPFISLNREGFMLLLKGYAWDGASGPTIDTKNTMRGTAYHDAAYQLMRMGMLGQNWRDDADDDLGMFLRKSGMSKIRSKLWVLGLDLFGRPAARPENRRKVITVT